MSWELFDKQFQSGIKLGSFLYTAPLKKHDFMIVYPLHAGPTYKVKNVAFHFISQRQLQLKREFFTSVNGCKSGFESCFGSLPPDLAECLRYLTVYLDKCGHVSLPRYYLPYVLYIQNYWLFTLGQIKFQALNVEQHSLARSKLRKKKERKK